MINTEENPRRAKRSADEQEIRLLRAGSHMDEVLPSHEQLYREARCRVVEWSSLSNKLLEGYRIVQVLSPAGGLQLRY
jgi:hypothetical protein